jgi:hypothetical protein
LTRDAVPATGEDVFANHNQVVDQIIASRGLRYLGDLHLDASSVQIDNTKTVATHRGRATARLRLHDRERH